jgi:hypothetical protein
MAALIELTPVELVLRVSAKSIGASEHPPNTNRGPYVERVQAVTGNGKGDPWCASEVADTGVIALGKLWPLPRTGGCQALANFAKAKKCRFLNPEVGDVFLLWYPTLGRFAHTGFCVSKNPDGSWITHDGNTSGGGSREGWMKAIQTRRFKKEDRFIRWTMLLP